MVTRTRNCSAAYQTPKLCWRLGLGRGRGRGRGGEGVHAIQVKRHADTVREIESTNLPAAAPPNV